MRNAVEDKAVAMIREEQDSGLSKHSERAGEQREKVFLLLGNPNVGKSVLFRMLSGK